MFSYGCLLKTVCFHGKLLLVYYKKEIVMSKKLSDKIAEYKKSQNTKIALSILEPLETAFINAIGAYPEAASKIINEDSKIGTKATNLDRAAKFIIHNADNADHQSIATPDAFTPDEILCQLSRIYSSTLSYNHIFKTCVATEDSANALVMATYKKYLEQLSNVNECYNLSLPNKFVSAVEQVKEYHIKVLQKVDMLTPKVQSSVARIDFAHRVACLKVLESHNIKK